MKFYFKYGSLVVCFAILFLLLRGCGNGSGSGVIVRDTISVKADTVYKPVYADSEYILQVNTVYRDRKVVVHDTLEVFEQTNFDTARVLQRFFDTNFYRDTLKLKIAQGYILVEDFVSQNKVTSRTIKERYSIPEITKTITLKAPPRTTLYLGADINGNEVFPIYSVGVNAGLVLKSGKYWGLQYSLTRDGNPLYGLRFMVPVRTKK